MMGRQTADQARLFYEFHLDERVPADHLAAAAKTLDAATTMRQVVYMGHPLRA